MWAGIKMANFGKINYSLQIVCCLLSFPLGLYDRDGRIFAVLLPIIIRLHI